MLEVIKTIITFMIIQFPQTESDSLSMPGKKSKIFKIAYDTLDDLGPLFSIQFSSHAIYTLYTILLILSCLWAFAHAVFFLPEYLSMCFCPFYQ